MMYPLFLIVAVALVVLSPVVLELYLLACEGRAAIRAFRVHKRTMKLARPEVVWMSPRLR